MIVLMLLTFLFGFVVISIGLVVNIEYPNHNLNYNFKRVPIINEGYCYNIINFIKFLLIALLYIDLICCIIYSYVVEYFKLDAVFFFFFISSPILILLIHYFHNVSWRTEHLIHKYGGTLELSSKENGDLWTAAYKKEMLAINPNVHSEPKIIGIVIFLLKILKFLFIFLVVGLFCFMIHNLYIEIIQIFHSAAM